MRPIDVVRKLAPRAQQVYLAAFEAGDELIAAAGITTPQRLAHFLAQVLHETGGLTILRENMNYTARRIAEVWPTRPEAVRFAGNPEALANSVYANRMGNGPPSSGDGYRYRGRGILQTTGRYSYAKFGKRWGVAFEADPELILSPQHALKPALSEWQDGGCNEMADRDDIVGITKRINGGTIGLADRRAWLVKTKAAVAGQSITVASAKAKSVEAAKAGLPAGGAAVAAHEAGFSPWAVAAVFVAVLVVGAVVVVLRRGKA